MLPPRSADAPWKPRPASPSASSATMPSPSFCPIRSSPPRQFIWPPTGLNRRSESGTSHQQHGKETAGENVERKAEAGPPHGDTGILNDSMMEEIENSVSGEGSHNQPKALLEA